MKKSTWVILLIITSSTKSFCQINTAASLLVSMISRETAKTAFPLYYAFDQDTATDRPYTYKEWKKEQNRQFDSLSRAIAKNENDPSLYYKRGLVKERSGATSSAKQDYDKSFQLGNRKRELFMKLGKISYSLGQRSNSISYFNSVLRKDSTDAEAYLHRGIAKLYNAKSRFNSLKERCEESIPDFSLALRFHPDYKPALILRGYANYYIDANEAAISDLTAATKLSPKKEISFLLLGKAYIETKQLQMACDTFLKAKVNGFEVPEKLLKQSCAKMK